MKAISHLTQILQNKNTTLAIHLKRLNVTFQTVKVQSHHQRDEPTTTTLAPAILGSVTIRCTVYNIALNVTSLQVFCHSYAGTLSSLPHNHHGWLYRPVYDHIALDSTSLQVYLLALLRWNIICITTQSSWLVE